MGGGGGGGQRAGGQDGDGWTRRHLRVSAKHQRRGGECSASRHLAMRRLL